MRAELVDGLALASPLAQLREGRLTRRLVQLYSGLVLYGVAMAMMIRAELGLGPWAVFHLGIADRTGLSFGTVTIIVGLLVLLLWVPLRQWPGLGTVSNALVLGLTADVVLAMLVPPHALWLRAGLLIAGIMLNGVATAAYIGARLGPGPRDGLMTGLCRRTGRSVRLVRTSIEICVLAAGWLLGGTVGVGTVLYALGIGPLVHMLLPRFVVMGSATPQVAPLQQQVSVPFPVDARRG